MTDNELNKAVVIPRKRNQWCPLCHMRRIKNCNACYWSYGCCRDEPPRKKESR